MALKGFSRDELITRLNSLAIDELAFSDVRWECITKAETGKSLFRMGLTERLQNVTIYRDRIKDYTEKANESGMSRENSNIYMRAVELLTKLMIDDERSTSEYQKKLFADENNIYNSRSYIEFPLDKKPTLNALYDDFSGVFLFYDDISTLGNNKCSLMKSYGSDKEAVDRFVETFCKDKDSMDKIRSAKTIEARVEAVREIFGEDKVETFERLSDEAKREFVANNVEFTHCLLGGATNPNWGIGVYGTLDPTFSDFTDKQMSLPSEYCDFNKVDLAMTLKIRNNDLLQLMQSKIDIDREDLQIMDERMVRGDLYQIKKLPQMVNVRGNSYEYLIRYVCPSTGRVYHNPINEENLTQSHFFKRNDPKTYIYAWWHINNGGDDPTEELDVIRC